jgi:hypothetical protein
MTNTEVKVERKGGGMPKWAFMKPYHSDIDGKRFLTRFIFFFTPYAGAHITRIHMADDQRKWPHDHSASFVSIKLAGGYEEDVYSNPSDLTSKRHRKHRWLSWHVTPWKAAHSITSVKPYTVTLLLLGRRRNHSSYWTDQGKVSLGMTLDLDNDPAEW